MANQIPEEALLAIEAAGRRSLNGMSAPQIQHALATPVPPRTLQYRLKHLVTRNRLIMDGSGRWARYRMPDAAIDVAARAQADEPDISLSEAGTAIRDYVQDTARAYGIDRKIRFHHRVEHASWSSERARWLVRARDTSSGAAVELECGFVFACSGYYDYDQGYTPEFPGIEDFAAAGDELPRRAGTPLALAMTAEPILPGELGVGQRGPQLLRRRADVGHIDECRSSHCVSPGSA